MRSLERALAFIRASLSSIRDHLFTWPPRCPHCDGELSLMYQFFTDDYGDGYLLFTCPRCGMDVSWSPTSFAAYHVDPPTKP